MKLKIKVLSLLLAVFLAATPVYASESTATTMYLTKNVNVRKEASKESKKIFTKKAGTKVKVLEKYDTGWSKIRVSKKTGYVKTKYLSKKKPKVNKAKYSAKYFKRMGVIHWNGWRWTWYSQRVLPGGGLKIPGRHVDKNGYVCDKNNYICIASSKLKKGTVVSTPFGKKGKVYDCGCAKGTLDVYTNW